MITKKFRDLKLDADAHIYVDQTRLEGLLEDNYEELRALPTLNIVDVGSGVGNLAITLALEFPNATVIAVEPHAEAYAFLQSNIDKYKLSDRITALNVPIADLSVPANSVDAFIGVVPNWPGQGVGDALDYANYAGENGLDVILPTISVAEPALKTGGFINLTRAALDSDVPSSWFTEGVWENITTPYGQYIKAYKL